MKSLTCILIYIGSFLGLFFLLSLVGIIWTSYHDVIATESWWMIYSLFIGWWISIFPTREYYLKHIDILGKL